MLHRKKHAKPLAAPVASLETQTLGDLRFRALLSNEEWHSLPMPVRQRFSKRLAGTMSVVYKGQVITTQMSLFGVLLAQCARLIGGPLPLTRDENVPAVVTVTEDPTTRGQFWSRQYNRRSGFPQVIHSSKRFQGETGLEEYVGHGVGMSLKVRVEDGALLFKSSRYFLMFGKRRWHLPKWLSPGHLTVTHRAIDAQHFEFILDIHHRLFGRMLYQRAVFEDMLT